MLASARAMPLSGVKLVQRNPRLQLVRAFASATAQVFPNEPKKPAVNTSLPGPRSQEATKKLDKVFDTRSMNMLVNYKKCNGN
jgi:4-aminobutyrate aminotransferase/(S)-3-amino-2-methylpropionate transaminase